MSRKYLMPILLLVFVSFNCTRIVPDSVISIIDEVESKFASEKRMAVFDVNAEFHNNKLVLKGQLLSPDAKDELMDKLAALGKYEIGDQIIVLPHPDLGEKNYGLIRTSTAQVRSSPEIESELISQAVMGSEVRLLKFNEKSGSNWWRYCQLEDGYLGWMTRSAMVSGDKNFVESWRKRPKLIVTSNYSQVKENAEDSSRPVSDLVWGNKMILIKKSGDWFEVELPDGRKGFVRTKDVLEETILSNRPDSGPDDIIQTAYSFIGVPYLWGGTSVKGFDCSGFTQSVFKFNRIPLPRDANMQVRMGQGVPLDDNLRNLKPADLLFWGPRPNRITHVGIYIGDNQFIHSDGMVRINSFDPNDENYNEYRRRVLKTARRFLDQ